MEAQVFCMSEKIKDIDTEDMHEFISTLKCYLKLHTSE
uniref:Uncharacterized protein n=1 Tax=Rhizophora mucronata TaxID=61149 RepID=A0A2P2PY16_RHIMU